MKILIFVFLLCFLEGNALAAPIRVDIQAKSHYREGEVVEYDFTISSENPTNVIYVSYVDCQSTYGSFIEFKKEYITPTRPKKEVHIGNAIEEGVQPQTCYARVQLLHPIRQVFSKGFSLVTIPAISVEIKRKKKVYYLGERVSLEVLTEVPKVEVSAKVIFPDRTKKATKVPLSFVASQIGSYELEVYASKKGYRSTTVKESFGIIRERAKVRDASLCLPDGICRENETLQNCPQDCLPVTLPP